MKLILLPLMMSMGATVHSENLEIFGTTLSLEPDCTLTAKNSDGDNTIIKLTLNAPSNCSVIKHSQTNVPHLVLIKSNYIVLIESTKSENNKCISNYTAIGIKPNGVVVASEKSKKSGTCNIGREEKVFNYFEHKMKALR